MRQLEVLRFFEGIFYRRALVFSRPFDSIRYGANNIISHCDAGVFKNFSLVFFLVLLHQLLDIFIIEIHITRPVTVVHRLPGYFVHRHAKTVSAHQDGGPTQFGTLLCHQPHLFIKGRHHESLCTGSLCLSELCAEIDIARSVSIGAQNLAPQLRKSLCKILLYPFRILAAHIVQQSGRLNPKFFIKVIRHYSAMIRISRTESKNIGTHFLRFSVNGSRRIGSKGRNERNTRLLQQRGERNAHPAAVGSRNDIHFFRIDQATCGHDRILLTASVIIDDEFQFFSQNTAGCIQFINCNLGTFNLFLPPGSAIPCQGCQIPYFDNILRGCNRDEQ